MLNSRKDWSNLLGMIEIGTQGSNVSKVLDRIFSSQLSPTALLILENGQIFEGQGFGAPVVNTGGLLQHIDDRLSGNHD